jgi:phosphate transport system protein
MRAQMMRWLQRLGPESRGLGEIHQQFLEMLVDGRNCFDAAANALLGGTDPEVIREDLFRTDQRINRTEQQIRRQIVVHGSIFGSATFPALLVMMSLVKDAERIGDYAKNIFDLAAAKVVLGPDDRTALISLKDRVSKLLVRAHFLFEKQDSLGARPFLDEVKRTEDECDAAVARLLDVSGRNKAGEVLTYRYFKRVTSHIGNIVTSLVVPLDKLDYFDG